VAEKPEGENVKKLRNWLLLSAAAVLAVLIGGRVQEAVVLDPDNMLNNR
jgi:hypothetical protein